MTTVDVSVVSRAGHGAGPTNPSRWGQPDCENARTASDNSLMMVTALSPVIGYDKASRIAHRALDENLTLKDAAIKSGVSEKLYDDVVVPEQLAHPGAAQPHAET